MIRRLICGFLAAWLALTAPISAFADATRHGASLGAQLRDMQRDTVNKRTELERGAEERLGITEYSAHGSQPGGVGATSLTRDHERALACTPGREFGLGSIRAQVESCEQDEQGFVTEYSISLCDASAWGQRCYGEAEETAGFTQPLSIALGADTATSFTGDPLNGNYDVSVWCTEPEQNDQMPDCRIRIVSVLEGTFGDADERQRADEAVQSASDHILHGLTQTYRSGELARLEAQNQQFADHYPNQVESLYAEGIVRSIDGRELEMGVPEDCMIGTQRESCIVDIPTTEITCQVDSQACHITREPIAKTCRKMATGGETIQYRLNSNNHNYREVRLSQFEILGSVAVLIRHSSSACTLGDSFGVRDDNVLWVNNGCRATFLIEGFDQWHDGCTVHEQRAPGVNDPEDLPEHPDLQNVAECYFASEKCLDQGSGACVDKQLSYTCYGEVRSTCDTEALEDQGWENEIDLDSFVYPSFPGYDSAELPAIGWTEKWTSVDLFCPDDPGFGCGAAFDITDSDAKKLCYTGPTPSCGPEGGVHFGDDCLETRNGVCIQQEQHWAFQSEEACEPYPGIEAPSVPFNEGAFEKALVASALMDQIAEHGAFDATGQFRLFGGIEHECTALTSKFEGLVRTYGAALTIIATLFAWTGVGLLVAAVVSSGLDVLSHSRCCQANPEDVNPGASFGYCNEANVDLAAARLGSRAKQVTPGSVPMDNSFCFSYAALLPVPPAKGSNNSANQICNHWSRPHSLMSEQIIMERYQRWCEFDSMLGRIVQEQGREQLNKLAASNAGGAVTRSAGFTFYGSGGWTSRVQANGNTLHFWQWNRDCDDPEFSADASMGSAMACPTTPDIYVGVCEQEDCSTPPLDPINYFEPDWEIHQLRAENHGLHALTRYVVVEGGCFDDGDCEYEVHAWPAGAGGQLRISLDMEWPLTSNFESGWEDRIWSHNNVHFRPYIHPKDAENPEPRLQICTGHPDECAWQEIDVPNPVTELEYSVHSAPNVTLLGECTASGMCRYRATVHVTLTAKPWYTYSQSRYSTCMVRALGSCVSRKRVTYNRQYEPHCEGFTLDEFMALDLSQMDLSEYIETLSTEAKKDFEAQWQN